MLATIDRQELTLHTETRGGKVKIVHKLPGSCERRQQEHDTACTCRPWQTSTQDKRNHDKQSCIVHRQIYLIDFYNSVNTALHNTLSGILEIQLLSDLG